MEDPNPEWRTKDLYLAAAFVAAGLRLQRTDREPHSGRFVFVFEDNADRRKFHQAWVNGEGEAADYRDYADAIKDLKSLVHQ